VQRLVPLLLFLKIEEKRECSFHRRHVSIGERADQLLELVVLDRLQTLYVHITFVMEERRLANGDFVVAFSMVIAKYFGPNNV